MPLSALCCANARRYFRHPGKMPVGLIVGDKELKAESTNLSEGGIALLLHHALPKNATPRLRFTLPGTSPVLEVETEIAWADLKGYVGLRFHKRPRQFTGIAGGLAQ